MRSGADGPSSPQCPVYDLDNNVAFIGMYQTMTKKAAITVQVGTGCAAGPCWGSMPWGCAAAEPPGWAALTPVSLPSGWALQKKDFPSNSFYVVVVVKTEDEACGGPLPYYPLAKNASPGTPRGPGDAPTHA